MTFASTNKLHWLIVCLLLAGGPALSQDVSPGGVESESPRWSSTASIGVNSWGSLQDLNAESGQGFDSVGWSLDFGGHRYVARWGSADVLLGADFGLFGTEGDVPGSIEDYTQRGLYLTPSGRLRFGQQGSRHIDLEFGMGWYQIDIVELNCSSGTICSELDEPFNSDRFGGYLGVSGGLGRWFVVGLRAHMVDFGEATGLGIDPVTLDGPVFTLTVGISVGR